MSDRAGGFPNRELVIYALFLLGGDSRKVHTEDVAIRCHELFPDSFSWARYPQYPDKDIVRVALTDARKPKHGSLVEGRAGQRLGLTSRTRRAPTEDGWRLTSGGVAWMKEHEEMLRSCGGGMAVKEHRQKLLKQLRRIRAHPLFERYLDSGAGFAPMIGEIADMLRCRVDAEPVVWEARFASVRLKAQSADQEDVLDFIGRCEVAVAEQL